MSTIYENAVDLLRIGFQFFKQERSYSTRKHAILTVFHAIELFFKERLFRTNPILIYKDIDVRVTEDALTVSVREALIRLENIGLKLPKDQIEAVERIQKIRNRIEHHRYDHNEKEDELVIGEALKLALYFVEFVLGKRLGDDIGTELFAEMQRRVFDYDELRTLADMRLEEWMKREWPEWNPEKEDIPEEFGGTLDCPACRQSYFVIGYHERPFCFHCNATVEGAACEAGGSSFMSANGCACEWRPEPAETAAT